MKIPFHFKKKMSVRISDSKHCANCATDRTINLAGVKIKDTMDKDDWSCGCMLHDYGGSHHEFRCKMHLNSLP